MHNTSVRFGIWLGVPGGVLTVVLTGVLFGLMAATAPSVAQEAQEAQAQEPAAQGVQAQRTLEEIGQSYVGLKRILRSYGDTGEVTLSYRRPRMGNDCDVAVDILKSEIGPNGLVLTMEPLGRLNVGGRIPRCGKAPREIELTVADVGEDEPEDKVRKLLDDFLMEEEFYLAERGVGFELVEDEDGNPTVQQRAIGLSLSGRAGGDCWLVIYPHPPMGARRKEYDAGVKLEATLMGDGTFSDIHILETPGARYNRMALRALAMWRCEPSLENGVAEPLTMTMKIRFRRGAR